MHQCRLLTQCTRLGLVAACVQGKVLLHLEMMNCIAPKGKCTCKLGCSSEWISTSCSTGSRCVCKLWDYWSKWKRRIYCSRGSEQVDLTVWIRELTLWYLINYQWPWWPGLACCVRLFLWCSPRRVRWAAYTQCSCLCWSWLLCTAWLNQHVLEFPGLLQ